VDAIKESGGGVIGNIRLRPRDWRWRIWNLGLGVRVGSHEGHNEEAGESLCLAVNAAHAVVPFSGARSLRGPHDVRHRARHKERFAFKTMLYMFLRIIDPTEGQNDGKERHDPMKLHKPFSQNSGCLLTIRDIATLRLITNALNFGFRATEL